MPVLKIKQSPGTLAVGVQARDSVTTLETQEVPKQKAICFAQTDNSDHKHLSGILQALPKCDFFNGSHDLIVPP